ncbi:hypothetical protein [Pseudoalteromonas luteoviolacea]|uniref:Peptidase n=1 Tax=Pseudoalteromonas luteoviolacea S4054 TaxID=1129367 RepID=A0A0F6ADB6_9GAMM|nr:hypothetical protein [Pseudoalteromonas luteoviolacea]AOT08249.1 hypothetical protein S4054249_10530 [Pseudoalteromonas luteoviolacea]AOT13165.1 hypothetical protein S40542_10505 [Pseudoalteromonas luteoviolacea]AOT18077.1 hypothetical protein S4054_10500 [Pseudoalteromonas luteoviolacea]KKE84180.1 hypothetical protein N479_09785 [Pseudoalteromonas luteoviolacea S4054]KZN76215.1 hypothetical protein N481_07630 [Pseudoalteromonas luteoviolacea S4047-1]
MENTEFDWYEIFTAGTHTDSNGNTQEFTGADLDSVVTNFIPKTSPLVIGHPKTNDPAWGWVSDLKVEDGKLFAKAEDVAAEFAEAVEAKRYPNRSVRLEGEPGNYFLGHVGYLGGKAPAVAGLPWQFNEESKGAVFEFTASEASERVEDVAMQTARLVTDFMGNLREWVIEQHGVETANRLIPNWEADWLTRKTIIAEHEQDKQRYGNHAFSAPSHNPEEIEVSDKTKNDPTEAEKALQAQLDAANAKNAQHEFNQRKFDAQTFIDTKVNGGSAPRITKTEGLAEFMAHLETGATSTFEFAASDGDQTATAQPAEYFKGLLLSLPEQAGLTKDFSRQDDEETEIDNSADALATKALEFQSEQANKGITISLSTAMGHVTQETN